MVAEEFGLDATLLHAIIQVESGYDANAVSPKGAIGLMQVLPATGLRFGFVNLVDPYTNVRAGSAYLNRLLEKFDNNLMLALAAYNAGERSVYEYRGQVPPYRETQDFVQRVLERYHSGSAPAHLRPSAVKTRTHTLAHAARRPSLGEMLGKLTGLLLSAPSASSIER